jgi:hypothetical protein
VIINICQIVRMKGGGETNVAEFENAGNEEKLDDVKC